MSAVAAANPKTVVVLKTGGPVLMPWLSQVSAVLEAWYPGEEDGHVAVDVTDTGARAGADVVQVYVAAPASAGEPPRQPRAFAKVSLRPGQTEHVVLTLDPRSFSVWDTAAGHWTTVPGRYTVYAGDSSRDLPLHRTLTVRR